MYIESIAKNMAQARALVIEDNVLISMDLASMLTSAGFAVDTAATLTEALEKMQEACRSGQCIELLSVDVELADKSSGLDAIREIDRLAITNPDLRNLAVVVCSSNPLPEDLAAHRVGHIQKPVTEQAYMKLINEHVERARKRRMDAQRRDAASPESHFGGWGDDKRQGRD